MANDTETALINWPQYTTENPSLLHFLQASNEIIRDDFRQDSYEYLLSRASVFAV